jgi:hypothetical protein
MIQHTGIVGVPFGSRIRYAVSKADVAAYKDRIAAGMAKANVAYND